MKRVLLCVLTIATVGFVVLWIGGRQVTPESGGELVNGIRTDPPQLAREIDVGSRMSVAKSASDVGGQPQAEKGSSVAPSFLACVEEVLYEKNGEFRILCIERLIALGPMELSKLISDEVCGTYYHGVGSTIALLSQQMPVEDIFPFFDQLTIHCGHFAVSDALFEAWRLLYQSNPGLLDALISHLGPDEMFGPGRGLAGIYLAGFATQHGEFVSARDLLHVGATGAYGGSLLQIDMALLQVAHEFEGDEFGAFMNDVINSPDIHFSKDTTGFGSSVMHVLFDPENADSITPEEQLSYVFQLLDKPFYADSTAPHIVSQMAQAPNGISDAEWAVVIELALQHIGLSKEDALGQ
jgi:hypothetical protein